MYRFVEFGKLSAGLIHDLMSPLTAICLETARRPQGSGTESIVGASRKIQDIIQATRRQIKAEFASERIPVLSIIDEVLLIHQSRIKKGGITVRKSMPMSLYLNGSPSLLSHLLTNTHGNAMDALADAEHPTLEIYASRNPTCVKITVRDNGIGIPDDIAAVSLDPFFTTKSAATRLGLRPLGIPPYRPEIFRRRDIARQDRQRKRIGEDIVFPLSPCRLFRGRAFIRKNKNPCYLFKNVMVNCKNVANVSHRD